jgi:hypothetical protein
MERICEKKVEMGIRRIQLACLPGLPGGTCICKPKSQFWYILEGVGMENVGLCTYIIVNWDLLRRFGIYH